MRQNKAKTSQDSPVFIKYSVRRCREDEKFASVALNVLDAPTSGSSRTSNLRAFYLGYLHAVNGLWHALPLCRCSTLRSCNAAGRSSCSTPHASTSEVSGSNASDTGVLLTLRESLVVQLPGSSSGSSTSTSASARDDRGLVCRMQLGKLVFAHVMLRSRHQLWSWRTAPIE
jgi:hypothetical protein